MRSITLRELISLSRPVGLRNAEGRVFFQSKYKPSKLKEHTRLSMRQMWSFSSSKRTNLCDGSRCLWRDESEEWNRAFIFIAAHLACGGKVAEIEFYCRTRCSSTRHGQELYAVYCEDGSHECCWSLCQRLVTWSRREDGTFYSLHSFSPFWPTTRQQVNQLKLARAHLSSLQCERQEIVDGLLIEKTKLPGTLSIVDISFCPESAKLTRANGIASYLLWRNNGWQQLLQSSKRDALWAFEWAEWKFSLAKEPFTFVFRGSKPLCNHLLDPDVQAVFESTLKPTQLKLAGVCLVDRPGQWTRGGRWHTFSCHIRPPIGRTLCARPSVNKIPLKGPSLVAAT